jgi:hypothetical protein
MSYSRSLTTLTALLLAVSAGAQTDPAAPAPAPAPAPAFAAGPITFGGLVDGYYSLNFAKLSMEHAADPVGFKLELAAGRAMDVFHATEPGGTELIKHLLQAYVSVKPESWKGVQFDFGKFVTSAGAEVTETHLNWNYSRSLLFANGPYYHFGGRLAVPVNSHFTAGVQLVNGWNNVEDNNSAKTVGLTAAITTSKVNWFNTYYVGNEKTDTLGGVKISAPGVRHFWDTVINLNPSGRVSGLINFDYGVDKTPGGRDNKFYGVSVAARVIGNDVFSFSPRYDWYKDRDGFITTVPQTLQEFTLTGDVKMARGFLMRLEYRRDWSSEPFFDRGNGTFNHKSQPTALVGFVAVF